MIIASYFLARDVDDQNGNTGGSKHVARGQPRTSAKMSATYTEIELPRTTCIATGHSESCAQCYRFYHLGKVHQVDSHSRALNDVNKPHKLHTHVSK